MKALELADKLDTLENFYAESSLWYDHAASDAVGAASDELRRLAEVNAGLVEALVSISDHLERIGDTRISKDGQYIIAARAAIAKAKEQQ